MKRKKDKEKTIDITPLYFFVEKETKREFEVIRKEMGYEQGRLLRNLVKQFIKAHKRVIE